jgi:hypothetical protein
VRAADGSLVKLDARRFPGGWKVTDEAIDAFLDALTRAAIGDDLVSAPASRTSARRRERELARVDAELDRAGIG